MCWTNKSLNRRIANKDIIVYKIVIPKDNGCISLFKEFNYDFHKKYTEFVNIDYRNGWYFITEGFHSYEYLEKAWKILMCVIIDIARFDARIVKCTIPKKATYYIDNLGTIVSSQIIINEYIDK